MKYIYTKQTVGFLFILVVVSGCYASSDVEHRKICVEGNSTATNNVVNNFILDPFKNTLKRRGISEEYLLKRFGKHNILSESNGLYPHSVRQIWGFDGVTLNIDSNSSPASENNKSYTINKISISKNKYDLSLPIKIGSTTNEIICQLGETNNEGYLKYKKLIYSTWGARENGKLTVFVGSNFKAQKILLEYFID